MISQRALDLVDDRLGTISEARKGITWFTSKSNSKASGAGSASKYLVDYGTCPACLPHYQACLISLHALNDLEVGCANLESWTPYDTSGKQIRNTVSSNASASFKEYCRTVQEESFQIFENCQSVSAKTHQQNGINLIQKLCVIIINVTENHTLPKDPTVQRNLAAILSFSKIGLVDTSDFEEEIYGALYQLYSKQPDLSNKWSSAGGFNIGLGIDKTDRNKKIRSLADILGGCFADDRITPEAIEKGWTVRIPPVSILLDIRKAFEDIIQPVDAGLIKAIKECVSYLLSQERTTEEVEASNQWLRRSITKTELSEITRIGLKNYDRELSPELVANYMKALLRSIPGSLIHRASQNLLIFLMQEGTSTQVMRTIQINAVIQFFKMDATRREILSHIGQLARFIFANSRVPILPENLAIVAPVSDEPGITFGNMLPKAAKAGGMMKEQMAHFSKWNSTLGYLLGNSDLFIDENWD